MKGSEAVRELRSGAVDPLVTCTCSSITAVVVVACPSQQMLRCVSVPVLPAGCGRPALPAATGRAPPAG